MLHTHKLKVLFCLILLLALALPAGIVSASYNAQSSFVKYGPSNGSSVTSTSPTIVWGTSSGATSYQYCVDTVNNASCDNTWVSTGGNTGALTGLSANTTYYWEVRANGSSGTVYADGGTWWSFTVVPAATATPTLAPLGKSIPVNGATGQGTTVLTVWSASTGAIRYEYCYDTSNNNYCDSGVWTSTGTTQYVYYNSLAYNTTYSWEVRAVDGNNVITYANGGTWWTFTTGPAPTPTFTPTLSPAFIKYGPSNGASVASSSVTIVWGSSAGATNYQYCYDTVNNAACDNTWASTGTTTMATLTGLSMNTPYYWEVRATNASGMTTYADGGTWWSFTIVPTPTPTPTPLAFGKSNPTNGGMWPSGSPLAWTASTGAVRYEYCLDTINNGACDTSWVSTGTSTYIFLTFASHTSYSWQVRAIDGNNVTTYANTGTWWTFTTP